MNSRRNEEEMMNLILDTAREDERIRAVIMNGSRTSPSAKTDIFQDYDIVYVVKDVEPFVNDVTWIKRFGDILIMQKPDEIDDIWPGCKDRFAYLAQFTDWNRLDLTLIREDKFKTLPQDSQSVLLLDKDNQFEPFPASSDEDYLPQPPIQKSFDFARNEFFWASLSAAKGIARKQLTHTKYVSEQICKEELIKLLVWYAGMKTQFKKSIGKFGKYLQDYLEPDVWNKFTKTYADADYEHIWDSIFVMCSLFNEIALKIAAHFKFEYSERDYQAVMQYLTDVRKM